MPLIPPERLFNWEPGVTVGIPGGIDQYLPGGVNDRTTIINITEAPYNADNTGVADCLSAINDAISAATGPCVIYFPAGEYKVTNQISLDTSKDNITIRGAGMNSTIIKRYNGGGSVLYLGSSASNVGTTTVSGARARGATSLTVVDASGLTIGACIYIEPEDIRDDTAIEGGAYPTVHVSSYLGNQKQVSKITAKVSNTITIDPPLAFDCTDRATTINQFGSQLQLFGVEDLTLDASTQSGDPVQSGIYFDHVWACWVRNVKIYKVYNRAILWASVLQCEVRRSELRERLNADGPNSAGILTGNANFCLFEDNIVYRFFPAIEVAGQTNGCVFAYNFLEDSRSGDVIGGCINSNHGPHNSFNLYEGNVSPSFQCDGYYGSTSEDTVYRNWLHQTVIDHPEASGYAFRVHRFTRGYNIVGNIIHNGVLIGYPNIGNDDYTGTAQPTASDFWADWATWKAAAQGSGPGPGGFQELDLDVEASSLFKGNVYNTPAEIPATEVGIGADPFVDSLFRDAKPAYFNSLSWPPFDPGDVAGVAYDDIPAGYRFLNDGDDPPSGGGGTTITVANVTNFNIL